MKHKFFVAGLAGVLLAGGAPWTQALAQATHNRQPLPPPVVREQTSSEPFVYLGHSPELALRKGEEGIASDGTNHFLIYRYHLLKVDSTWTNVLAANDHPFEGLEGYDHLGDGEYFEGKLYVATESYHGCGHVTNQSIFIFNPDSLQRLSLTCVSNYTTEVSSLTMVTNQGPHGVAFVSNFCDDSRLYKFNLPDFSFAGTLPLDEPIRNLQGVAWHNGLIYAVADDTTNGLVYSVNPVSGHTRKLAGVSFPHGKEVEGCVFSRNGFEILVSSHARHFNHVYYFSP